MNTVLFDAPGPKTRWRHRLLEAAGIVVVVALVAIALSMLVSHGFFTPAAWAPFAQGGLWRLVGLGLLNNVTAAIVAMILSMAMGLLLAFGLTGRSRMLPRLWRSVTATLGSIPVLLFLFFISLMLPAWGLQLTDFWFLVIALTLYSGAVIGDLIAAGVQALPRGQSEAAAALGFSPVRTMVTILLPQAMRNIAPALVSQLVIVFKGTALAYVLGGYVELLHTATVIGSYYSQSALQALVVAAVLFMAVNIGISALSRAVERYERRRFGLRAAPRSAMVPDPQ
ncbi:MAG TPA: amino acid ABC transporter permease [Microbacterium sp.]|uniref:amino acid ABC transporter permease n=1 Tax=Microbacterium sp. TaxID=51671 RepID=UPI002B497FCB|nr:amino acid ABC transporter permease [Microbacterium sp.]HKT56937.1 amino acid ABC transporter permease [Microbacterium sp.]